MYSELSSYLVGALYESGAKTESDPSTLRPKPNRSAALILDNDRYSSTLLAVVVVVVAGGNLNFGAARLVKKFIKQFSPKRSLVLPQQGYPKISYIIFLVKTFVQVSDYHTIARKLLPS